MNYEEISNKIDNGTPEERLEAELEIIKFIKGLNEEMRNWYYKDD